jgi:hypothetical protein
MVQYGQNAGPRHLCVFGHVRNLINSQINKSECTEKDHHLLGIFDIIWNIFLSHAPASVIDTCNKVMDDAGVPHMESVGDIRSTSFYPPYNMCQLTYLFRNWLYSRVEGTTNYLQHSHLCTL